MSSEMSAIMTGAPEDPLPHGLLVPRRHVSHLSRLTPHIPLTGDSMPSSQHAYLIEQSASSNECKRAAPPEEEEVGSRRGLNNFWIRLSSRAKGSEQVRAT